MKEESRSCCFCSSERKLNVLQYPVFVRRPALVPAERKWRLQSATSREKKSCFGTVWPVLALPCLFWFGLSYALFSFVLCSRTPHGTIFVKSTLSSDSPAIRPHYSMVVLLSFQLHRWMRGISHVHTFRLWGNDESKESNGTVERWEVDPTPLVSLSKFGPSCEFINISMLRWSRLKKSSGHTVFKHKYKAQKTRSTATERDTRAKRDVQTGNEAISSFCLARFRRPI